MDGLKRFCEDLVMCYELLVWDIIEPMLDHVTSTAYILQFEIAF